MSWGYTLEVYKKDGRVKGGERLVLKKDYEQSSGNSMMDEVKYLHDTQYPRDRYRLDFFQTWVQRQNAATGEYFWERYDVPYTCSPSSETYWSS